MGGERRAKYKKYSHKGKLKEKNSCTPINPKKYLFYVLKKIHARNLITTKIPAARKFPSFPPPTHNFSNGPSLNLHKTRTDSTHALTFGGKFFACPAAYWQDFQADWQRKGVYKLQRVFVSLACIIRFLSFIPATNSPSGIPLKSRLNHSVC